MSRRATGVSKGNAGAKSKPKARRAKPAKDRELSRAAERRYRIHALLGMSVKKGLGPLELMDVAVKGWGVSSAVASRMVAEAYELCISSTSLYDRLRMAAIQLSRMESLLRISLQERNLGVALGTNREINNLIFTLAEFEKAQEEAGDGGAGAAVLTPEQQEEQDREGDF